MGTLLGHLAQFASFAAQGELLCTQGLAYLLQHPDADAALRAALTARTGFPLDGNLSWVAEEGQAEDQRRPDLEARRGGDRLAPVVKIEAKLGALFGLGQLQSYANDLAAKSGGLLIVVVPRYRVTEAGYLLSDAFQMSSSGIWHSSDQARVVATVISWEEVLTALLLSEAEPLHSEVAQFDGMYRALTGADIEPLAGIDDLIAWREREGVFWNLADRVTRHLTGDARLLPMRVEGLEQEPEGLEPRGYRLRFVCRPMADLQPCFSVGVRDPFAGHLSPIWLRFHKGTPGFAVLRSNLQASSLGTQAIPSGGHLWMPLEVPLGADGDQMVADLVAQAEAIVTAAFGSSP